MKTIIISLVLFSVLSATNYSLAQDNKLPPFEGGSLSIWHSNSVWADHGMFAYQFTIDSFGILNTGISEITDLVIETNYGNIDFSDLLTGSGAGRYVNGDLYSEGIGDTITIIKATGTINQTRYDLTKMIQVEDFKPLRILLENQAQIATSQPCPTKSEPLPPIEAIFDSFECVNYCYLFVKLNNGKDDNFLVSDAITELMHSPNSVFKPGTRIQLSVESIQWYDEEYYNSTSCNQAVLATSISVVK
jgi:hypothetical protein